MTCCTKFSQLVFFSMDLGVKQFEKGHRKCYVRNHSPVEIMFSWSTGPAFRESAMNDNRESLDCVLLPIALIYWYQQNGTCYPCTQNPAIVHIGATMDPKLKKQYTPSAITKHGKIQSKTKMIKG